MVGMSVLVLASPSRRFIGMKIEKQIDHCEGFKVFQLSRGPELDVTFPVECCDQCELQRDEIKLEREKKKTVVVVCQWRFNQERLLHPINVVSRLLDDIFDSLDAVRHVRA